jgi:hypothetical protein
MTFLVRQTEFLVRQKDRANKIYVKKKNYDKNISSSILVMIK